jgi:peptidyl-prolyl cis-trans isomerase C
MKKMWLLPFALLCLTGIVHATDKKVDSKVVAQVNDEKIYQSGIDVILQDLKKTGAPIDDKTKTKLVERLVEQKIVAQYARKNQYEKRADVQRQLQLMTEMVLRDSYLSDIVSTKVNNNTVKAEYNKMMTNYKPRYEYKASHILVENKETADEVLKKIKAGEKFDALAKVYSKDSNAKKGGDLGYFTPDMMVTPFSNAVVAMKLSQISQAPVKTDFGWHVIQLNDKRALPKPTLEKMTPQIEAQLSQKVLGEHIAMLKKQSQIKIFK